MKPGIAFLFFSLIAFAGQDYYGGNMALPCSARGAAGTIPTPVTYTIASVARSGNVDTFILSATAAPALYVNEPILISGTTASGGSFNTPTANAATQPVWHVASLVNGTTFTVAQTGSTVTTTATGGTVTIARAYEAKIGNDWWMCTPWGYTFYYVSAYNSGGAYNDNTSDFQSVNLSTVIAAEYTNHGPSSSGDKSLNWADHTARRLKSWGFTALAEYNWQTLLATYTDFGWNTVTSDRSIPTKLPFFDIARPSYYGLDNHDGYASGPVKDLKYATKYTGSLYWSVADFWDPNYAQYFDGILKNDAGINCWWSCVNNEWFFAADVDESDEMGGVGPGPDFPPTKNFAVDTGDNFVQYHSAWLALVSAPTQYAVNNGHFAFGPSRTDGKIIFPQPSNYTKADFASWLNARYSGNIASLNTAWGSNYDSFTSDGTKVTGASIGSGTGSSHTFSGTLHANTDPFSVGIFVAGTLVCGDDGSGNLIYPSWNSAGCSGTVNASTGAYSITINAASGAAITANYTWSGWGKGKGILDEDGSCPAKTSTCWVPSDFTSLTGATATFKSDMNAYLLRFWQNYFSTVKTVLNADVPGLLYMGTLSGGWGAPARAQVLQAQGQYADLIYLVQIPPNCTNCTDVQARIDFVASNAGDKPWLQWDGYMAQTDSYMWAYRNRDFAGPCNASPGSQTDYLTTQAGRAAAYTSRMNHYLTDRDTATGTRHTIGFAWWELYDNRGECSNWGLLTRRNNPYVLNATSVTTQTDPGPNGYGYQVGGESGANGAPYGDFLTPVTAANALWLQAGSQSLSAAVSEIFQTRDIVTVIRWSSFYLAPPSRQTIIAH